MSGDDDCDMALSIGKLIVFELSIRTFIIEASLDDQQ